MAKVKVLEVRILGKLAGYLVQNEDGRMQFNYDLTYISRPQHVPVSLAIPFGNMPFEHPVCHAVFGGMLPEGDQRGRLAAALGVSERNDFSLLAEIGGECAGAVSLQTPRLPKDPPVTPKPGRALSAQDLERIFKLLPSHPLLTAEGVRLSLAGAQNKLALAGSPGAWRLPAEDEPSTYILKTAAANYDGILENELFCMRLADEVGLPVAKASLLTLPSLKAICVERFDRHNDADTKNRRIHQEDFCQALGIPSELKYQSEGGPSIVDGVNLLRSHSSRPAGDVAGFLKLVQFNYLVGNADAHAKNYSLLWPDHAPQLAPAYDLLSTAVYPGLQAKQAMRIGSEYDPRKVYRRHWESLAKEADLKPSFVLDSLMDMNERMKEAAPRLAKALEAETGPQAVYDKVQDWMAERRLRLRI